MRIIYLYILVLFLSTIINYYIGFGFLIHVNSGNIAGLWFLFYAIVLPVKSMTIIFNKYKALSNFYKYNLFVFLSYLFGAIVSGIKFFDFKSFVILGDGPTKFVMGTIYFICFISSFTSLLIFQWKSRRFKRKNTLMKTSA